jgi:hypothetical protein
VESFVFSAAARNLPSPDVSRVSTAISQSRPVLL